VIHAEGFNVFVTNTLLTWKSHPSTGDYYHHKNHNEQNDQNGWWRSWVLT